MAKLKLKLKLNKTTLMGIATILLAAGNILIYFLTKYDSQIVWIGFILVWLNLVLGWFTYRRLPSVSYLFLITSLLIELLIVIDIYWVSSKFL